MRFGQNLLYLACATLLASCGGGGDDGTGDVAPSAQQYPAGVWIGTAGPIGGAQQPFFGVIGGETRSTGGAYYFAKDTGGIGYDGLYGTLSVSFATLRATGSTYYSTTDAKFSAAAPGITVLGTMSGASNPDVKTDAARISGNYSDPAGTAASVRAPVPFRLSYSSALTEHASGLDLIKGTYRTGGFFGPSSVITVDSQGKISGTNAGCTLAGTVSVPNNTRGIYGIFLTATGTAAVCPQSSADQAGAEQTGVAVVQYDAAGTKTGLWMFTFNSSSTSPRNTFALNATADAPEPTTPPSTTQQIAEGLYTGTISTAGGVGQSVKGVVLPNNQYFFYRDTGSAYDVLFGSLNVTPGSSTFTSTNGIYFAAQNAAASPYSTDVLVTGDVRTRTSLNGRFNDPSRSNATTTIATTYDSTYIARPASLASLAGRTYTMNGNFLGRTMTISIDAAGAITGTTSDNCGVTGSVTPYSSLGSQNLYNAILNYSGTACALLNKPQQNGVAVIDFDGVFNPAGLRILTASASPTTGERFNTVFLGTLVASPAP